MKKLLLLIVFGALGLVQLQASEPKSTQPNVVLILIDDLSMYGVTAYGANRLTSLQGDFTNVEFATPRIDKLAETGLLCDNAFAYPLCEATRIALMSGKYNNRNFLKCKSQHASDITFGDAFKKAGYATGIFGKWKQTRGTKEVEGKNYIFEFGWDEFCCFDVITEGKRFINPNLIINGEIQDYQMRTDLDPITQRRWYGPDIVNRHALSFIDNNKDKPFFLYYPMLLIHDEHQPTPDTEPKALFDDFDEGRNANNPNKGDDRRYLKDMIEYMDKLIGNVVDRLDKHELRENTLIVVMGDNGTKECFGHVLANDSIYPGRKGGTSDNGLHVPLVINQPGKVKAGNKQQRHYKGLVDITDIYPTIAEAAGIEIPYSNELDGISFWPQVMGKNNEARKVIYTWYNNNQPHTSDEELLVYVFDKEFKRYAPNTEYPEGRFFDLRSDPLERAGDRVVNRRFGIQLFSGLALDQLSPEQQLAYNRLGKVIDAYSYEAVEGLKIVAPKTCQVGDVIPLKKQIKPSSAMRKNIVWESSNPQIASINKFGELTAHRKGEVSITMFSWDDAYPVSANWDETYKRNGVSDVVEITIR